ncbi:MAG: hypothetical protein AAF744_12710 [Pseudomonadota bacterium]
MIRLFAAFAQSTRPLIVVGIGLGFAAVYATHGTAGLWFVGKLVAIGIVMNFAAWLAFRWAWNRYGPKDED